MSFNDNIQLDPSRVRTSAGRRAAGIGGGSVLGAIIVFAVAHFTGIDLSQFLGSSQPGPAPAGQTVDVSGCTSGADANTRVECRMVATASSLDEVWRAQLASQGGGTEYQLPDFQIFTGSVSTACGNATSAVGPFYCPGDSTVYLDLGFFEQMVSDYGASGAALAQEYVVAHEWGHHIQNLRGVFRDHNTQERGEQGAGVRSELQADCYAGVWMHWASQTADPNTGEPFLRVPSAEEIDGALTTAQAIGDDRLQQRYQGSTNSESWTHGSAAQRSQWLRTGLDSGSIAACDTWSAARV